MSPRNKKKREDEAFGIEMQRLTEKVEADKKRLASKVARLAAWRDGKLVATATVVLRYPVRAHHVSTHTRIYLKRKA
jgi:hypothetical protein